MADGAGTFETRVVPRLRAVQRRLRLYVVCEGIAALAGALVFCFLLQLVIDWNLRLRVDLRAGLLAVVVAILARVVWQTLLRPLRQHVDLEDVASVIERRIPAIDSRLISAVQLNRGGSGPNDSAALVQAHIEQTADTASRWPFEAVLAHSRAVRHGVLVFAVIILFGGLSQLWPEMMRTWFDRNVLLGATNWRQHTTLTILNDEDGDGMVYAPRGDDFNLAVRWDGERPDRVWLDLDFASGSSEGYAMTAVGTDEFRHTIHQLDGAVRIHVRGNDARPDPVDVEVVDRPGVESASVIIQPPAYTTLEAYELAESQTLIEVLPGSKVELVVTANKPLASAALHKDGVHVVDVVPDNARCRTEIMVHEPADYTFAFEDELELVNINPRQFMVRLSVDAPPAVRMDVLDVSELVTDVAQIPLTMMFRDHYGLQSAALMVSVDGAERHEVESLLEDGATTRQLNTTHRLAVADFGLQPGQRIAIQAEAQDFNHINGPGIGVSAAYTFKVVTPDELLAELARREQEYAQEFQRLIAIEERIRGDVLSVARKLEIGQAVAGWSGLQRRQRQVARQVSHVREQFERIYNEMELNQVGSKVARLRLVDDVIQPLEHLAGRLMTQLGTSMDAKPAALNTDVLSELDGQYAAVIEAMHGILDQMSRWEGFHEAVNLLQSVIRMQKDLKDETTRTMDRQFEELFGEPKDKR